MTRHKKRRNVARKATPVLIPARKQRLVQFFKIALICFLPVVALVGVWIHMPRAARPFVPGFGIEAECAKAPEVKMTVQIKGTNDYRIALNFGDLRQLSCTELKIVVPADLVDVTQLHNIRDISPEALRSARRPFNNYYLTRNELQQPVLKIPTAMLGSEPFALELSLSGIIQDSFERFRLLIPKAGHIYGEPKLSTQPRVELGSIAISSRFDMLTSEPHPAFQKREFGPEILFFNAELSEINILFLDRVRETWKMIFDVFVLAVIASLLASAIWSVIQRSKGHA